MIFLNFANFAENLQFLRQICLNSWTQWSSLSFFSSSKFAYRLYQPRGWLGCTLRSCSKITTKDNVKPSKCQCQPLPAACNLEMYCLSGNGHLIGNLEKSLMTWNLAKLPDFMPLGFVESQNHTLKHAKQTCRRRRKICGRQWDFQTKFWRWKLQSLETQIDLQACNVSYACYEQIIKN